MPILILLLRIFISYIFILSGWAKVRNPGDFEKAIHAYQILPRFAVAPFAFVLARAEIALGFLMGLGLFTRITALFIICFLSLFVIAIVVNIVKGKSIPCGCLGKSHNSIIGWNLVVRDFLLFLVIMIIYFSNGGEIALDYFLINII